jgi:HK97 family phage major capsid protein
MQKALLDARAICDLCEKEKRDFTADERTKVSALLADATKLKGEIKAEEGDAALKQAILDLGAGIEMGGARPAQQSVPAGRGKSIGEQFIEAPAFKEWMKHIAPSGSIPESTKGLSSPPVEFKHLITGTDQTSAGAFVQTDYTGIYEPLGRYPLNVLGLVARRTTTSDLVEFVRQTVQVQEAAPTPEANVKYVTGATGEVSGTKPQGQMAFEKVHAMVKTIAVYVGATKRALSDAAQIRGIIDQELRDDLNEELEQQIMTGNGVGENFTGVLSTAGVLTQAFNTNILTTCRQAVTTLQVTGRARPNAWVFNPVDWETVELLQDVVNRYYGNGPFAQGPNMLWGYPVVTSQSKPAGTAILADWRKAVLWDREAASISVTDSHEDWFIRNLVAILAEMRAAFGLIRPSAFCEVELA